MASQPAQGFQQPTYTTDAKKPQTDQRDATEFYLLDYLLAPLLPQAFEKQ